MVVLRPLRVEMAGHGVALRTVYAPEHTGNIEGMQQDEDTRYTPLPRDNIYFVVQVGTSIIFNVPTVSTLWPRRVARQRRLHETPCGAKQRSKEKRKPVVIDPRYLSTVPYRTIIDTVL